MAEEALPLSVQVRVDAACQAFEAAWKAAGDGGTRPRIEDYLAAAAEAERGPLLRELLKVELHYRRGESPSAEEYRRRFPQYAAELGDQFPATAGPAVAPGASPARAGRREGQPGSTVASTDRNLLCGVLALQLDFVGRDALMRAMQAWVLDKARPLVQILTEQGGLSAERRELLEGLVREHLRQHGEDPRQSLAALSSLGSARAELAAVADADVQASLARVGAARPTLEQTVDEPAGRQNGPGQRFRILRPHARGALGEVYVALDAELHREVALKEIQERHVGHPESRARFLLEAEITGGLEHPGVVPVYGLGHYADGRPFYAMRFVKGDCLKDAIERFHRAEHAGANGERELRLHQLLGRFVDVCNAVAYAHSRGVLHRDLKPGNIMLGAYGETLVVDWGLAKVVGRPEGALAATEGTLRPPSASGSAATEMGRAVGTPAYMSPEQAAGKLDDLGPATDIYSLGATLYALLTNRAPVAGSSVGEVLQKVQCGDWPPPRVVNPTVPPALDAVCRKAMALVPAERYPTALALAEDVQRYLADEPVTAYREGIVARAWRWAKRHRRLLGRTAAAAVLLGVLLGSAAWVWQAERRRGQAQREAETLRRYEDARTQVAEFRRLADEMTFYAAGTNPVAERTPYYDPGQAEAVGRAADAIVRGWGPTLEELAVAEEQRPLLREEVHDFLLLLAQLRCQGPGANRESAQEARDLLERARALQEPQEPSRSYYRLSAVCARLQGDGPQADRDQRRYEAPNTRSAALDHFLMGEQERALAARTESTADADPDVEAGLRRALDEYTLVTRGTRQAYWAHFQKARCYLALGEADRALEALAACSALRADAPWAGSVRGLALALQRQYPEAESELQHVLDEHPDFAPARLNLGAVYWLQKQYEPALEQFDRVGHLPPGKPLAEAAYYRGRVRLERGDRALEDFNRALRERPEFRPAYLARAQAHLAAGEEGPGLDDLNAYLRTGRPQFDPRGAAACAERGRLLTHLAPRLPLAAVRKALDLALRDLRRADQLGHRSPILFDDLGDALYLKGQLYPKEQLKEAIQAYSEAIQAYARGLELAPEDVRLLTKRGWAYVNAAPRQDDAARKDFAAAARVEPKTAGERLVVADAHAGLGYLHACKGETTAALEEAVRATLAVRTVQGVVVRYANHYRLRHNLACIYGELSRTDDKHREAHEHLAVEFLREAAALAQHAGVTADEVAAIKAEPAFPLALRKRDDFQELLKTIGR
jgi:Tfp pilus assembly protein PilF/tRNA A-37 threonylcarbamoyl transferase component Bud32